MTTAQLHRIQLNKKPHWKFVLYNQALINPIITARNVIEKIYNVSLYVSVDVSDAGETSENRGPSSSQTEGKSAVLSGMYGRKTVVFTFTIIKCKFYFLCETLWLHYNCVKAKAGELAEILLIVASIGYTNKKCVQTELEANFQRDKRQNWLKKDRTDSPSLH